MSRRSVTILAGNWNIQWMHATRWAGRHRIVCILVALATVAILDEYGHQAIQWWFVRRVRTREEVYERFGAPWSRYDHESFARIPKWLGAPHKRGRVDVAFDELLLYRTHHGIMRSALFLAIYLSDGRVVYTAWCGT